MADWLRRYHVGSGPRVGPNQQYKPGQMLNELWDRNSGLYTITGGEWRRDQQDWIVTICREIARRVGMPSWLLDKLPGDEYWHYGARLIAGWLYAGRIREHIQEHGLPELPYLEWAKEDYAAFQDRKEKEEKKAGRPVDTIMVFGMPTPLALVFFAGLPTEFLPLFEDLVADTVNQILEACPDIAIQWELPAEYGLAAVPPMPRRIRKWVCAKMMGSLDRVIACTPVDSLYFGHVCKGDLKRRPFVPRWRQTPSSRVDVIDAFTSMKVWWKEDGQRQRLLGVQDPLCDGKHRPRFGFWAKRAYNRLKPFPPGAGYIPGSLQPDAPIDVVVGVTGRVLKLMRRLGIPVKAIAPACGEGRLTTEQAAVLDRQRDEVNKRLRRAA